MDSKPAQGVLPALFLAILLSFIDRVIFSLALQPLKLQFGFSDSELGLLAGVAFGISYALFGPVAGWLADHRSRKMILIFAILVWSAATLATAFANSFGAMFAARAFVGMGEAAVTPLAVSLLSDTRGATERSKAFGVFLSASALGTALSMIFGGGVMAAITRWGGVDLPILGRLTPWQTLFAGASSLGVIYIAGAALFLREPARAAPTASVRAEDRGVWTFIKANRAIIVMLYLGMSLIQMATVSNLIWIVPAFGRAHGLAPSEAALMVGSTAGIAMVLGSLVVGWVIARRRARGDVTASLTVCLSSAAFFGIFTAAGLLTRDLRLALALVTVGCFFTYAPTTSALAVLGEALPPGIRARLTGFNSMSSALICNALGSILVGVFGDRLFSGKNNLADALALVIALGIVGGGFITLLGLPAYRYRMQRLNEESTRNDNG